MLTRLKRGDTWQKYIGKLFTKEYEKIAGLYDWKYVCLEDPSFSVLIDRDRAYSYDIIDESCFESVASMAQKTIKDLFEA